VPNIGELNPAHRADVMAAFAIVREVWPSATKAWLTSHDDDPDSPGGWVLTDVVLSDGSMVEADCDRMPGDTWDDVHALLLTVPRGAWGDRNTDSDLTIDLLTGAWLKDETEPS